MKFEDAPCHTLLVAQERMDDDVRKTFYVRLPGDAALPNFVPAYRVACVQGSPWRSSPL